MSVFASWTEWTASNLVSIVADATGRDQNEQKSEEAARALVAYTLGPRMEVDVS